MDELPQIERSIDLPADPDTVWERMIDGGLANEWLGIDIDPRTGGRVQVPDREMIGTVEEIVPGRSITWSWRDVDGDPSQVEIEIHPIEDGTRVTVVERLLEYRITGAPPFYSMAA